MENVYFICNSNTYNSSKILCPEKIYKFSLLMTLQGQNSKKKVFTQKFIFYFLAKKAN